MKKTLAQLEFDERARAYIDGALAADRSLESIARNSGYPQPVIADYLAGRRPHEIANAKGAR